MIVLVALLNVTQPMPSLDRNWINRQARREMLVAASASGFGVTVRPHNLLPLHFAVPSRTAIRQALLGGPSGM